MDRGAWRATVHRVAKSWIPIWVKRLTTVAIALQCLFASATQHHEISHVYTHTSPPSGASLPPSSSRPLGHHGAWSWAPCAVQQLPLAISHVVGFICQCYSLSSCPPLLPQVHKPILHSCTSILALLIVHQYHFPRFHIYTLVYDMFSSLWFISLLICLLVILALQFHLLVFF